MVRSLDASYPRRSYLSELPAVYREDEETTAFLERFLALFERVFTDVDAGIDDLTRFLDPDGIPADPGHLEWLGTFLAAEMDDNWPTAAKRAYVERAPELYRMRGTRRGLEAAIDCYLDHVEVDHAAWDEALRTGDAPRTAARVRTGDPCADATRDARDVAVAGQPDDDPTADDATADDDPDGVALVRVVEHAALDCIETAGAREPYDRLLGCPQGFLVLLHPVLTDEQVRAIGRIVRHQRPTHASGRAVALRPLPVLAGHDRGDRGVTFSAGDYCSRPLMRRCWPISAVSPDSYKYLISSN